ncbi:MAG: hypothetical protein ACRDG8_09630 [Actinomycetota bacterium]
MNCSRAQLVLSARMDGERVGAGELQAALAHSSSCATCTRFSERATWVRGAVRIRPAEPVPDLVTPIMSAVATEPRRAVATAPSLAVLPNRAHPYRPRHRRPFRLAPAAAAAIVGVVIGSLLVGGPWQRPTDRPIAAAAVVRSVRNAAPALDAFQATYAIRELGLSSDVPERRLEMDVAFLSPQRFRMEVHDRTRYPTRSWTPTDLLYVQNVTTTFVSGPSGCPGDLAPDVCPRTRATVTRLSEFSAAAPLPADLILPVTTFGSPHGVEVIGTDDVAGRRAVRLRLSFSRAEAMFPFRRLGGTWRPFFERDRVLLWLDSSSWLPLRYVVYPSVSEERREWELRFGLPSESPEDPILDVRMVSWSTEFPDDGLFRIPGARQPTTRSLEEVADRIGYSPATPAAPEDLSLVSVQTPPWPTRITPRTLLVYADGLDYLKVGERADWTGPGPFGPVDAAAERVDLPGGGVGYYEPAGEGFGRRLAIHASAKDLYLESNLPRQRLLAIAASLPLLGEPLPASWRTQSSKGLEIRRVPVEEALEAADLHPSLLSELPPGYVAASAEISSAGSAIRAVTLHLRRLDMDAAGGPITLHVEPGAVLPRPSSAAQSRIRLGPGVDGTGRWTPARSQLEWIDDGSYHSLQGELGLRTLIAIASAVTVAGR